MNPNQPQENQSDPITPIHPEQSVSMPTSTNQKQESQTFSVSSSQNNSENFLQKNNYSEQNTLVHNGKIKTYINNLTKNNKSNKALLWIFLSTVILYLITLVLIFVLMLVSKFLWPDSSGIIGLLLIPFALIAWTMTPIALICLAILALRVKSYLLLAILAICITLCSLFLLS